MQRHCGIFSADLNVPFGTFVMADVMRVVAPVGEYFDVRGLEHPLNAALRPAFESNELSYDAIKSTFPKTPRKNPH